MSDLNKRKLIVLTGPTAVGKTELSINVANKLNGSIISADSIQIYKYMDIGSAKITKDEMKGIKHYLIDELMPDEEFNIYVFQKLAKNAMNEIYSEGKIPIITGGTGFYIQSLLYDIDFTEENNDYGYRHMLEKEAEEKGTEYLHKLLRKVDPQSADSIHMNNVKRVIRALEFYKETGEKFSEHNAKQKEKTSPYDFKYYVLNRDRNTLYDRIDKRIDIMLEQGLVKEVENLLNMGYDRNLVSMQGLGYKEIATYLEGECSLDEAIYILKRDTRHFAKRQITWFRREKSVIWINYEDYDNDIEKITKRIIDDEEGKNV